MKTISIFAIIVGIALIITSLVCLWNCSTVEAVNNMARMTITGCLCNLFGLLFLAQNLILRRLEQ